MQKRKLFIEIKVPGSVKKRLQEKTEKWKDLPVKWTKKENLHITLLFLGYVDETALPEICYKVSEVADQFEVFDLNFNIIEIGPIPEKPRMIWFSGEASEELKNLYQELQKTLGMFQAERKEFRPHVNLGKIRKTRWEELENKPQIKDQFKVSIPVENICVMESREGEDGREYHVIENCTLS